MNVSKFLPASKIAVFILCLFAFFSYSKVEGIQISEERKSLSQAIKSKNIELVKSIMESSSMDIDTPAQYRSETPLMEAAYCGDLASVLYFIGKGANVNIVTDPFWQETPLQKALEDFPTKGDYLVSQIAKTLIDAGADINEPLESEDPSPFMKICSNNARKCVQVFIDAGVDINAQTSEGKTALFYAIEAKSPFLVETLISAGANINICDFEGTPLFMHAAASGIVSLTESFFKRLTDFTVLNYKNQSALFFVANTNDIQTANFLLSKGLNSDQRDINGYTPFLQAVHSNKTEMAIFFVECGANASVKDYKGISPIEPAAKNGNVELLNFLVTKQVPIDTPNSYGFTPLMQAITNNHIDAVDCLIAAGASMQAHTRASITLTPASYSLKKEYLIPAKTTPLELAKILERTDIVEFLTEK